MEFKLIHEGFAAGAVPGHWDHRDLLFRDCRPDPARGCDTVSSPLSCRLSPDACLMGALPAQGTKVMSRSVQRALHGAVKSFAGGLVPTQAKGPVF